MSKSLLLATVFLLGACGHAANKVNASHVTAADPVQLFVTYCSGCHNGATQPGGVRLDDAASVKAAGEKARSALATGAMPPFFVAQPSADDKSAMLSFLTAP